MTNSINLDSIVLRGQSEIDGASCTFFRVAFGALAASWAWDYLLLGRVAGFYVTPTFHFTYYGLGWVQPWPGNGMYFHFWALLILAVFIAAGFLYRIAALLFAIGFTYFFLLDRTNYQNHYYLITLISWWLPWLPLNRNVSVDAWLWPRLKSQTTKRWCLWVLQLHVAIPYFFGGIAKLDGDWLMGAPLRQMLLTKTEWPVLGDFFASDSAGMWLAWAGLMFDLAIVPLLVYRRTRVLAYCSCLVFHLMNAAIFDIHVFPWFMIAATTLFFEPNWPRRVLGGIQLQLPSGPLTVTPVVRICYSLLGVYLLFHCLWPLRHNLYEGNTGWNERGHHFAWRMMLRGKMVVLGYAIKDKVTGNVVDGNVNRFINPEQSEKFGRDPEMILQFAHFLGTQYKQDTGHEAAVYALVLASLNGRMPELFIDPNVDLMTQKRGFGPKDWVLPQQEPLRQIPWDAPVEQWRQQVELPPLEFLRAATRNPESPDEQ